MVVLLHGFLGDPEEWLPVAEHLAGDRYVLAPVLPGHDGEAPAADDYAGLVQTLAERLEPHLPEQFLLAGYSLGGRLALGLAAHYPHHLSGLVLEGAHPGLQSARERRERRTHDEHWASRMERESWAEVLDAWYRQPIFADLDESQRQARIDRRRNLRPSHLAATLRAASLAGQPDMRPLIQQLDVPLRYIVGGRDRKFIRIARSLERIAPALAVAKLPSVGHNCHAEAPEAVAQILDNTAIRE